MTRLLDRSVITSFCIVVILLLLTGFLQYRRTNALFDSAQTLARSHQLKSALRDMLAVAVDVETGVRGFLLTGHDRYLEPYRAALLRLDADGAEIVRLSASNPEQRQRADAVNRTVKEAVAYYEGLVQAYRDRPEAGARSFQVNDRGKFLMDSLRGFVSTMDEEEAQLLAVRERAAERNRVTSAVVGFVVLAAALLVLTALIVMLRQSLRARAEVAADIEGERERFRTTLASIADAVITTDQDGIVGFSNSAAHDLTGYSPERARGLPVQRVFRMLGAASHEPAGNPALRALQDGRAVRVAERVVLASLDGPERPIEAHAAPITDEDGGVLGSVLVFRDVTERREAETRLQALLQRERDFAARLAQVAAASRSMNTADSQDAVLLVVEDEARRILGARHAKALLDGSEEPIPGGITAMLVGRGGRSVGRLAALDKPSGFTEDDRAILTQLGAIAAVALDNVRLYEELRETDRRKDEFLATLAHELRNPLAPIVYSLPILASDDVDPIMLERSRATIERQVRQMVRLVDDLLDLSRVSRGKIQLRVGPLDLTAVVTAAIEASRPLIEERGHALDVRLPATPVRLYGDLTRLAQVFTNLLNNAAKYTEPGGRIFVTADSIDDQVVVRVRDTGMGIPPPLLPRVFDMFAQVQGDRTYGGLGIGLALVRRLLDMHGGAIEARSEGPGRGSEFVVRLPITKTPAQAVEHAAPAHGRMTPRRVLIVEDNRDAAASLETLLRLMGHDVRTAFDGEEGLEAAHAFHPDVAFLDLGLPKVNGFELARKLREKLGDGIKLVAVTGWGQEQDRMRSRAAGFDHHLVKPAEHEAIAQLLMNNAESSAAASS